MSLYQRLAQERHGDVPRTTSVDALERPPKTLEEAQLRVLSLLYDLEARLVDAGASAKVRAKWKRYLDYDYHIRMFAGGYKELPVSDVVGRYNNLVSLARALTQTTIDRLAFPEEDDDE